MRFTFIASGLFSFCLARHPTPGPDKSLAGAVLGAGWGAGAGAVIGNQTNNTGPGAAIGSAFGAGSGLIQGIGLDVAEGTELDQRRELDAIKVQVAANRSDLAALQYALDQRQSALGQMASDTQVFFDQGKASLRAGAAAQLQRFSESIKANPYVGAIEIHGHSDDTGNAEENIRLSEARAQTVSTFLISQGVSLDQLKIVPHGARAPLVTNENESGRQFNRRVELVIVKR